MMSSTRLKQGLHQNNIQGLYWLWHCVHFEHMSLYTTSWPWSWSEYGIQRLPQPLPTRAVLFVYPCYIKRDYQSENGLSVRMWRMLLIIILCEHTFILRQYLCHMQHVVQYSNRNRSTVSPSAKTNLNYTLMQYWLLCNSLGHVILAETDLHQKGTQKIDLGHHHHHIVFWLFIVIIPDMCKGSHIHWGIIRNTTSMVMVAIMQSRFSLHFWPPIVN
jgi:hypothetical protein